MKNLLILLLLSLTLQNTQAQQPITFERAYSDSGVIEIEDKKNVPIKIGPNPFEDIIYIDLVELLDKEYQVVLYDVLGIELINKTVRGGTAVWLPIELSLPSASYFLQIRDKEKVFVAIPLIRR